MTKPNETSDEAWATEKVALLLALIQSRAAVVMAWVADLNDWDD